MAIHHALRCFFLAALVGCQVGTNYERPDYPVPESFRSDDGGMAAGPVHASLGSLPWSQVFTDPVLQELVWVAVADNYDVRAAAERVLEARAYVTIASADRYPDIQATVATRGEALEPKLIGSLAWEIDFWGRVARTTEAARAEALGSEFAHRAVLQTLVADLALAYFDLLELDAKLEIARRTYSSRQHSYELTGLRLEGGVISQVELSQSESLLLRSAVEIPALEQLIEQQENLIRLLVGANPGAVPRGISLLAQKHVANFPIGLPLQLLERRPDVRLAEQNLVATNARSGEAKALLFPTMRLGAIGTLDAGELVSSIVQPIFNAGRLGSGRRAAESRQRQAALTYSQVLQRAFGEVADALVECRKSADVRLWNERLEEAGRVQAELTRARFHGDAVSYLEVLTSERDHFEAELGLVRATRNELFAYVYLYRALGGGWQGHSM